SIRHLPQPLIHQVVNRSRLVDSSRSDARERLDSAIASVDRINMELSPLDCRGRFRIERQIRYVAARHHHALVASQTNRFADAIKSFDLLIDPADSLHMPVLINRAGTRK